MKVDERIFKSYDIRGIYPSQLDEELAKKIAIGFVKYLKPKKIILGRDARTSGPSLHKEALSGILESGVDVIDIGECSSDMFYYACAEDQIPGMMITASHNPSEYNGFKMVEKIPYFLTGDGGIEEIKQMILNNDLDLTVDKKGEVSEVNIMDRFAKKILSLVDIANLKPLKIVADPANGMVGPILSYIEKDLAPVSIIPLYFEPDGTFPNHGGDPLQPENREDIKKEILENDADLGVMFDPDGDRFFVLDKTGRFISGDFMTAILSKYFLKKSPGAKIVYDIRASKVVPDWIKEAGGTPLYNKVGHSHIKKRMIEEDAVFGGEVSGHYYFADFYYCDTGILTLLYLLEYLSQENRSLAEIVDEMEKEYYISGEINSEVKDVQKILNKLESMYEPQALEINKTDGITVEMKDYRFNVRGSNTEPKIRLNLEANNKSLMEEKRDEVLSIIRE